MDGTFWYAVLFCAALLAANLPFLSDKRFFLVQRSESKAFGWRLVELALMYAVIGILAYLLEARQGQVYPQGWEFYAATVCLFLVLAFPGFVWRFLWNGRK